MVNEKIRIHGGESFEIDLGYAYKKKEKKSVYDISTYIFVPRSLDISAKTYSKEDFFQDLKTNIRFITPLYDIKDILFGSDSAYSKLIGSINDYSISKKSDKSKQFRYHVKMFVSIYRSSLSKAISKALNKKTDEEISLSIEEVLNESDKILKKYRQLSSSISSQFEPREINVYKFGDEFLSYTTERQLLQLIKKLTRKKFAKFEVELMKVKMSLKRELDYQKEMDFIQMSTQANKTNEDTVYRRGILRKFAEDRLFLNLRTQKDGKILEQVIFSLAAGLSMVFATSIAFASQLHYGNFTLPFFVALVISYMAKDRIKELVRNNINEKLQSKFLFYQRNKIVSGEEELGVCKESFQFIEENKLPSEVKKARNRNHLTEIENDWKGENIMYYRKRIRIYNKRFKKVLKEYEIQGLKDIIRLNVSKFTTQMSSPYLYYNAWDENSGDVLRVKAEKVYHLNMIMLLDYDGKTELRRYRIFLNKNGIKRIESVKSVNGKA